MFICSEVNIKSETQQTQLKNSSKTRTISVKSLIKFNQLHFTYKKGDPQNQEFVYKKMCIYSHMFKLQSPSYSPFHAIHLSRHFFHCSKQFLNSLIVMLLWFFCFTSYMQAKHFPLRAFFIWENKKKSLGARAIEQGGWGTGVLLFFHPKTAEHSAWCGQVHLDITHCEMGTCAESSKTMSLKLNAASHNTTSWSSEQMGSQNTYVAGETCTVRGPPSRR